METADRHVLRALAALLLVLPLLRGGNHPWAVALGCPVVLALLVVTVRERWRRSPAPAAPGVAALAAFAAFVVATTLPLPPEVVATLSPATARLYATVLPGWPNAGDFGPWRPLALDPYAAAVTLAQLALGFGTYAVLVAYPWRPVAPGDDPRARVFQELLVTLLVAASVLAGLALLWRGGSIGWITGPSAYPGRVSGPFVNPNHFAGWLEMLIPVGVAYTVALLLQVHHTIARAAHSGRGRGVDPRRAWLGAVVRHQRRLAAPLVSGLGVTLMLAAHVATGSRGGTAALLAGIAVTVIGVAASRGRESPRPRRAVAAVGALGLVAASVATLGLWAVMDGSAAPRTVAAADPSLAARLVVATEGAGVVHDYPLVGVGLGSWLHAFRRYQAPPVDGAIWDHAHDDYLELVAEVGLVGVSLALVFALAVVRAARGSAGGARLRRQYLGLGADRPFPVAGHAALRWGLAGGLGAILVHGLVDFGLRMPANLALCMAIAGLLVLSGRPLAPRRSLAPAVLIGLLVAGMAPALAGGLVRIADGLPLASGECLARADLRLAEDGVAARAEALTLIHRALERSPASRDAHEALAAALGPGDEADAALRRAVWLEPWAMGSRDRLAWQLWERGARTEAAAELEESFFRIPFLVAHGFLAVGRRSLSATAEGGTLATRLAALDEEAADALERGLARALATFGAGEERMRLVGELATLLEARGRWADAAQWLTEGSRFAVDQSAGLARAARDHLRALDDRAAERDLVEALGRTPGDPELYRALAVDVYAARGDFTAAEGVLAAGQRNAVHLQPIRRAAQMVLTRRESARAAGLPTAAAAAGAGESR